MYTSYDYNIIIIISFRYVLVFVVSIPPLTHIHSNKQNTKIKNGKIMIRRITYKNKTNIS